MVTDCHSNEKETPGFYGKERRKKRGAINIFMPSREERSTSLMRSV